MNVQGKSWYEFARAVRKMIDFTAFKNIDEREILRKALERDDNTTYDVKDIQDADFYNEFLFKSSVDFIEKLKGSVHPGKLKLLCARKIVSEQIYVDKSKCAADVWAALEDEGYEEGINIY